MKDDSSLKLNKSVSYANTDMVFFVNLYDQANNLAALPINDDLLNYINNTFEQ